MAYNEQAEKLYESTFITNYNMLKNTLGSDEEAAEQAVSLAELIVKKTYSFQDEQLLEEWKMKMYVVYQVGFIREKISIITKIPFYL